MSQKSSNNRGKKKQAAAAPTKRASAMPAFQLPTSERQEMEPVRKDGQSARSFSMPRKTPAGKISVPLITPSDDATKPTPRVMMDKEQIEAQGKRWGLHQQSSGEAAGLKNAVAKPAAKSKKGAKTAAASDGPIHKDMLISDIMLNYPQTLDILMAIGLHCIGCQLSAYDTLESGCALHGMDEATIAELVKQMNARLKADPDGKTANNTGACCSE